MDRSNKATLKHIFPKYYDIPITKIAGPINLGCINNNIVYKVYSNLGTFTAHFCKTEEKHLDMQKTLMQVTRDINGISTPEYVLPTQDSHQHFKHKNGQYIYIKNWVEGTKFLGSKEEISQAAISLSKLHQATKDLNITGEILKKGRLGNSFHNESNTEYIKILKMTLVKKELDMNVLKWLDINKNRLILAWERLVEYYARNGIKSDINKRVRLLHGDYTPNNVLFNRNGKVCGLLDYSSVKYDDFYRELSWSALTFSQNLKAPYKVCQNKYLHFIREYGNYNPTKTLDLEGLKIIGLSRCLKIQKNQFRKQLQNITYNKEYLMRTIPLIEFLIY